MAIKGNYNRLTTVVLRFLCDKPVRLTGNEVRFIRQHFEMTLQEFAVRFAVSHAAVIKWEKSRDEPTGMNWASEKDLRLFVLSKISGNSKDFAHLYQELERSKAGSNNSIHKCQSFAGMCDPLTSADDRRKLYAVDQLLMENIIWAPRLPNLELSEMS